MDGGGLYGNRVDGGVRYSPLGNLIVAVAILLVHKDEPPTIHLAVLPGVLLGVGMESSLREEKVLRPSMFSDIPLEHSWTALRM